MKKLNLIYGLLIGLMIFTSCSKDENTQLTKEELLVQNSPWTFDYYELINIVNQGNSTLTQQELETDMNQEIFGATISFSQNGTGSNSIQGGNISSWEWEITEFNELKLTFNGDITDNYILNNIKVTENEFIYEEQVLTDDSSAGLSVIHYGEFHFK